MSSKKKIRHQAERLADEVRAWSESQVELWQQVPNLALEANGRDGWSADLSSAEAGYWRVWVHSPRGGYLLLSVDCTTGQFVNEPRSRTQGRRVLAPTGDVLQLVQRLGEIDAAKIIRDLSKQAQVPRPGHISRKEWANREEDRERTRQRGPYGFGIPFTRSPKAA